MLTSSWLSHGWKFSAPRDMEKLKSKGIEKVKMELHEEPRDLKEDASNEGTQTRHNPRGTGE
jgi:hypothetical protein